MQTPTQVSKCSMLHAELESLAYPVIKGLMDPEHWCITMQSDRGIPLSDCISYLQVTHSIFVDETSLAYGAWPIDTSSTTPPGKSPAAD